MPERRVTTRMAVEGEPQYKAALKNINSELKAFDSELKISNATLKSNGASIESLKAKQQALTNVIAKLGEKYELADAQMKKAKEAQKKWAEELEKSQKKLTALETTTDDAGKETEEYRKKLTKIQAEINRYSDAEQKAARIINYHTAEMNDAAASTIKYQSELRETEYALQQMGDEAKDASEKSAEGINALASALAAAGVAAAVKKIAEALIACSKASVEFESALAGVAKTTGLADVDLGKMSDQIKALSTRIPTTAADIAKVAEAAGQLGIANKDIMGFTEVMLALGVATNMTADEAATSLARFANITGLAASQYENLGSAIVALGNTTATTEKEIVDMAMNLAAAGKQAGLTDAEIMGIAAALSSVGLEAASGGTAFSRWMKDMQVAVETGSEKLETFASVAGMSAEGFASAWESSPITALNAFFKGLGSGTESAIVLLEEMGVTNVRTSDTAIRLANAGNLMTDSVNRSVSAFKDNVALAKEAETRYDTTASKIQIFKNSVDLLKVAVGDDLNPSLRTFVDIGTDAVKWAADFVSENKGVVPVITGVVTALATFTAGVGLAAAATTGFIAKLKALALAAATNPYILAATAIASLAAIIVVAATNTETATENAKELVKTMDEVQASFDKNAVAIAQENRETSALAETVAELAEKENKTATEKAVLVDLVDELNGKVPSLALAYDETADSLVDLNTGAKASAESILALAKAQSEAALRANEIERVSQLYQDQAEIASELYTAEAKLRELEADLAAGNYEDVDGRHRLVLTIRDQKQAIEELTEKQNENVDAIARVEETYGSANDAISDTTATVLSSAEAQSQAAASVSTSLQTLAQDYKAACDSARESMDEQYDLWDAIGEHAGITIQSLTQNAADQEAFWASYSDNLQALLARNIPGIDEFAASFCDNSEEAAAALAALAGATDEQISAIMDSLAQADLYKETLAETFGSLQVDLEGQIESLATKYGEMFTELNGAADEVDFSGFVAAVSTAFESVGITFETAGTDAGNGFTAGLEASSGGAETAASAMAQAVINATRTALNSHSPSLVMHEIGAGIPQGMAGGINDTAAMVTAAIDALNMDAVNQMNSAGVQAINAYVAALNSNIGGVSQAVDQINNAIDRITRDVSVSVNVHTNYTSSGKQGGKATGMSYVPYDEFNINLHKGEMVLTALQAEALRAQQRVDLFGQRAVNDFTLIQNSNIKQGDVQSNAQHCQEHISVDVHNHGNFIIREEADIQKISESLAKSAAREMRYKGANLIGGRR